MWDLAESPVSIALIESYCISAASTAITTSGGIWRVFGASSIRFIDVPNRHNAFDSHFLKCRPPESLRKE